MIEFTEDTGWALAGWRYLDPTDGQTKDTTDPNSVVINANTVFTAIWAQTFYVAYDPGSGPNNHGGTGFTTLQRGGTDIGLGVKVKTLPLIIGGADRTKDAPAADGYKFIGWTWKNGGDFYWITDAATAVALHHTPRVWALQLRWTSRWSATSPSPPSGRLLSRPLPTRSTATIRLHPTGPTWANRVKLV